MRRGWFVCAMMLGMSWAGVARAEGEAAAIEKTVERALTYTQGDLASLTDAKDDFSEAGWGVYMKWMSDFLDAQGAPTGSSTFTPTGDPVVENQSGGSLHVTVPGTLMQWNTTGRATYHVSVKVQASGSPLKIDALQPTITH